MLIVRELRTSDPRDASPETHGEQAHAADREPEARGRHWVLTDRTNANAEAGAGKGEGRENESDDSNEGERIRDRVFDEGHSVVAPDGTRAPARNGR